MNMFKTFLRSLPKDREDMVNHLEVPDDLTLAPYIYCENDATFPMDSLESDLVIRRDSSDYSLALSRAMTDSDIDYNWYNDFKSRSHHPWEEMRIALNKFPKSYLDAILNFDSSTTVSTDNSLNTSTYYYDPISWGNEDLIQKMEQFFDKECTVFEADDPGLLVLQEALECLDLKSLYSELDELPI